jgi:hypothetical protein
MSDTARNPDDDVQQAQQFRQQMSSMYLWAAKRASEYRLIADYIEDDDVEGIEGDPDELRQAAEEIEQITHKINYA